MFQFGPSIAKGDIAKIDNLTDEENKQLHPFVVQRLLTGSGDANQLAAINEWSNTTVFHLSHKHRLLSWYVLASAAGTNRSHRYQWIKPPSKAKSNKPISEEVLKQSYRYDGRKAADALKLLDVDDIISLAENLGYEDEQIKLIKKEFKNK